MKIANEYHIFWYKNHLNLKFKILSFIQKHKITTFIEYRVRITFFVIKFHCILFRCIWSFQSVLEILMDWTFKSFDFNKERYELLTIDVLWKEYFYIYAKTVFPVLCKYKKRISQNKLYLKCKIVISLQF